MKNQDKKDKLTIDEVMKIMFSDTDPLGSYTGVVDPSDDDKRPIQDADDL